jgi:hypothetical protein
LRRAGSGDAQNQRKPRVPLLAGFGKVGKGEQRRGPRVRRNTKGKKQRIISNLGEKKIRFAFSANPEHMIKAAYDFISPTGS